MPTSRLTNEIIEAAILGSEEQKRRIDVQIAELRAMLSGAPASAPVEAANVIPTGRPRRKVSAAGRKAMALAQKKRSSFYRRGTTVNPALDNSRARKQHSKGLDISADPCHNFRG